MADRHYAARRAAADLQAAGLLAGVLAPRDGRLAPVDPATVASGFAGAGLDSRNLAPDALFVALRGERVDGRDFAPTAVAAGHWVLATVHGASAADPLPGTAAASGSGVLLTPDPVAALGVLGRAWRRALDPPVAAVTGTNGKTTTKDFLAALLGGAGPVHATSGNLNNHLGVPLTLLGLEPRHRWAVIEMGASAEGEIASLAALAEPDVGIITNAAPAHLAEFGSLEGIIRGKGELVAALPPGGTAILDTGTAGFAAWCRRSAAPVVSCGAGGDHPWSWRSAPDGSGVLTLDGAEWPVPLPGEYNGANLVLAILAGRALGLVDEALRRGLVGFRGSPHRGVRLELAGCTVLDDSYNANPRSMLAAAAALVALPGSGRAIAVLGAMAELGPASDDLHRGTGRDLAALGVDLLVTVGAAAQPLAEGFDRAGGTSHHCGSHAEAAAWLIAATRPGDRILVKGSRSAGMERVVQLLTDGIGSAS